MLALISRALEESQYATITPDSIAPGYNVRVVTYEEIQ